MQAIEILFENSHFIIVSKPPGMFVHSSKMASKGKGENQAPQKFLLDTLRNQFKEDPTRTKRKLYAVHRLDRNTSGCIIIAYSPRWANILSKSLCLGKKTYIAQVYGDSSKVFDNNEIISMEKSLTTKKKRKYISQSAQTIFKSLDIYKGNNETIEFVKKEDNSIIKRNIDMSYSVIMAQPKTGRTHQIRKHLNMLKLPIIHDNKHGEHYINRYYRENHNVNRMLLHCFCIEILIPDENQLNEMIPKLPIILNSQVNEWKTAISVCSPIPGDLINSINLKDDMWNKLTISNSYLQNCTPVKSLKPSKTISQE